VPQTIGVMWGRAPDPKKKKHKTSHLVLILSNYRRSDCNI